MVKSPGNEGLHGMAASPTHEEQLLKTSSRHQRTFILNVHPSLTYSKILHSPAYSACLLLGGGLDEEVGQVVNLLSSDVELG